MGFWLENGREGSFSFQLTWETHDAHAFCCKALWYLVSIGFQHPHTILFPPWQFKEVTISQPIIMISTPQKANQKRQADHGNKDSFKTNQTPQNQKISWKPLVQLDELPTAHQLCFPLAQSLGEVLGSCSLTPAPPKHRRHGQRTQELNFVDGSDVILNSQQGNKKPFNK